MKKKGERPKGKQESRTIDKKEATTLNRKKRTEQRAQGSGVKDKRRRKTTHRKETNTKRIRYTNR